MRGAVAEAYVEAQENAKFSWLRAPATKNSVRTFGASIVYEQSQVPVLRTRNHLDWSRKRPQRSVPTCSRAQSAIRDRRYRLRSPSSRAAIVTK